MVGRQVEKLAGREEGGEGSRVDQPSLFVQNIFRARRPPPLRARGLSQADSQAEGKHGIIGCVKLPPGRNLVA